jgi:3',5'-cyclic AMP phosphodiesterase CpdA
VISVLHFSDVHVQDAVLAMPLRELVGKRLVGAANLLTRRGALFRNAVEKLAKLATLRDERAIDLALCTGDYTALGSEGEYRAARSAVSGFMRAPAGFVTVPGNHDLYLADTLGDQRFERHFGDLMRSDVPELRVDGLYPFVRLFGDELAVIGVNSAKPNPNPFSSRGSIPKRQLDALEQALAGLSARVCIVMTHYAPLRRDGTFDTPRHGLAEAVELMAICARPRVMLVHGHIHDRYHHQATQGRPWMFGAGSATHLGREAFWVYEVDQGAVRAIAGTYQDGQYQLLVDQALDIHW